MKFNIIDLGLVDYNKAYFFQKEIVSQVRKKEIAGAIIFSEHFPVFTVGRSGNKDNFILSADDIKARGINIIEADRGGDITFHGPGQIVGYPVFDLRGYYKDLHRYMRSLEDIIIRTLSCYGINSFKAEGRTGCWTKKGKIASIGIAATGWITYHGFALNVNMDLSYFDMINPCGFSDISMTSIKEMLGKEVDTNTVKSELIRDFEQVFSM
jgi:lipoyl(octanoyl) transferase